MKRVMTCLLLVLFLFPSMVSANTPPLENTSSRTHVAIPDTTQVTLVTFYATLRVRTGFTSVNTQMVVRNDGTSDVKLITGIPTQIDTVRKISKPTVTIEGDKQKIDNPRGDPNPKTEDAGMPDRWYTWALPLKPGETKVIECVYTIDNGKYPAGTEEVFFPLHYLKYWNGPIEYLQVVADLDFYPPYVFDPQPSILPETQAEGGRLTWKFEHILTPEDLKLYFRPVDTLVNNFFINRYSKNKDVRNIIDLYSNKAYQSAIVAIDSYLNKDPEFEDAEELKFLKALSYQELYQLDKALEIYSSLEGVSLFDNEIGSTLRNRLIYDKFSILESQGSSQDAFAYISQILPTIQSSPLFLRWAEKQIDRLKPPEAAEPAEAEPDPAEEPGAQEEPVPEDPQDASKENLIKSIEVFGYSIPVEYLFLGGAFLLILIYMMTRGKRRRTGYLFR